MNTFFDAGRPAVSPGSCSSLASQRLLIGKKRRCSKGPIGLGCLNLLRETLQSGASVPPKAWLGGFPAAQQPRHAFARDLLAVGGQVLAVAEGVDGHRWVEGDLGREASQAQGLPDVGNQVHVPVPGEER